MSLFDVIKHSDIDIRFNDIFSELPNDFVKLPKEVIFKWHARLVEHACHAAESIAYQDKSGKYQELIDATRAFMRNEITTDELYALSRAANAVFNSDREGETANAYATAISAYYTAIATKPSTYAAQAAKAVYYVNEDETAKELSMKMYKDWLIEELLAHDSGEMSSVV